MFFILKDKRYFQLHKWALYRLRERLKSSCIGIKKPDPLNPLRPKGRLLRKKGYFEFNSGSPFLRGLGGSGLDCHNLPLFKYPLSRPTNQKWVKYLE